jgi:hypothetical protein
MSALALCVCVLQLILLAHTTAAAAAPARVLLLAHTTAAAAAPARVQVSTSAELLRALQDANVSTIELLNDLALEEAEFRQFETSPLLVNR